MIDSREIERLHMYTTQTSSHSNSHNHKNMSKQLSVPQSEALHYITILWLLGKSGRAVEL